VKSLTELSVHKCPLQTVKLKQS